MITSASLSQSEVLRKQTAYIAKQMVNIQPKEMTYVLPKWFGFNQSQGCNQHKQKFQHRLLCKPLSKPETEHRM